MSHGDMTEFRLVMYGMGGDADGDEQRWEDHRESGVGQRYPFPCNDLLDYTMKDSENTPGNRRRTNRSNQSVCE